MPVALVLMTTVTSVAIASGALAGGTPEATIARWGFSLDNLGRGRLLAPVTAALLVVDTSHFVAIILMLAFFVGSL